MRQWTAQRVAAAAGARLIAPGANPGGPELVTIDSREAGPGALFVGLAGQTHDGGRFAPAALENGAWGALTTPDHASAARRAANGGAVLAAAGSAQGAPGARHRLAATAQRRRDRRHRLDRQDLDQGPARRAALKRPPRGRLAGELQHRDWPAAGDPRGACGHRCDRARDGDARGRADRRTRRDRGARRRGDRQHRSGPPRAARDGRGRGGGKGGADRRAVAGVGRDRPGGEPRLDPHRRADLETITFGNGGDVRITSEDDAPGRDRRAGRAGRAGGALSAGTSAR